MRYHPDAMATAAALPSTMRVVACSDTGATHLEERALPAPSAGELLLELICCGLCGTDLFKLANANVAAGTVLGHEVVGRVVGIGDGVNGFGLGQRVVAPHHVACGTCALCARGADTQCATFKHNLLEPGGFSEYVLVRERAVRLATWRVPTTVTDAAAAFMEPAACVLRGVRKADPAADGCSLVLGGGSMGLLHLLLLRALLPGHRVVVCDPMPGRRELAVALGAFAACPPQPAEVAGAVRATSEVGADAVFDTVGGAAPLELALSVLRPGGSAVLFAHAGRGEPAGFELNRFFKSEQRVIGTYSGGLAEQREVADLLSSGIFDPSPLVSHRMPLARFAEAVALARERQALKILLEPA